MNCLRVLRIRGFGDAVALYSPDYMPHLLRYSDSNSSVIVAELQTDKALMAEKAKKIQTKGGLPATGSLVRAV